jgi:hypothetical protein
MPIPGSQESRAWVIEAGTGLITYWDGNGQGSFSSNHEHAVRFSRQVDAIRLLSSRVVVPPPGEVKVIEHEWGIE